MNNINMPLTWRLSIRLLGQRGNIMPKHTRSWYVTKSSLRPQEKVVHPNIQWGNGIQFDKSFSLWGVLRLETERSGWKFSPGGGLGKQFMWPVTARGQSVPLYLVVTDWLHRLVGPELRNFEEVSKNIHLISVEGCYRTRSWQQINSTNDNRYTA